MMRCSVLIALLSAVYGSAAAACGAGTSTQAVVQAQGNDLADKLVVITGGDSGIGYETALALAGGNATVLILSYDAAGSGKAAADNITRLTGNPAVAVQQLDLSSFASVRAGAAAVLAKHAVVDFLVCDAGIASLPGSLSPVTDDGFERVMQVNYLGHFLLVDLLLPALRASGAGRVVHLSSLSAFGPCGSVFSPTGRGCTDIPNIEKLVRKAPTGFDASNYGLSKFVLVYHARELAARETGPVTFYSARPGFVTGTGMNKATPAESRALCKQFGYSPCPIPIPNGGATPAYLVAAPSLPSADNGDLFFFCAKIPRPTGAEMGGSVWDADMQSQLYDLSKNWTAA